MINSHLLALQDKIQKENIDLYYLNTSDYHMSEYVPEYFKTIEYFSCFTGSLATLLVSKDDAFIFVDGRYHTQADKQCLPNGVKVIKLGTKDSLEPLDFIKKYYPNKVVGIDGKRTSIEFAKALLKQNNTIVCKDIYSDLIENRTPLGKGDIYEFEEKYAGLSRKKKIEKVINDLNGQTHIVDNLESIAYLLNLRSNDILYTPVFLAYLIIDDSKVYLFVDENRLRKEVVDNLNKDGVIIKEYDAYYDMLDTLTNKKIVLDENKINYETYSRLDNKNNEIINSRSLIEDIKSIKNSTEQDNIRLAHIYDGVSMLRFLMWIDSVDKNGLDEFEVSKKIDEFRLSYKAFDLSFNSIVAYNENSAIIHYSPTKDNCKKLSNSGVLLLDTGGQYYEGTTDITRTIALGQVNDEVKKYFTLVLKSMFNLSELKFMHGLSGNQVDIIARKDLWSEGVDYRHGTGHGVGHVLSVHEGPPNIRYMNTDQGNEKVSIVPGMIFSDEPGVYFENKFGIRCENLLLCKDYVNNEYGRFLEFETLTLVPFDTRLIDSKYLDQKTIDAINNYHSRVYNTLSSYLNDEEKEYLRKLTMPI